VPRDETGETDGTICDESEGFSVSEKTWERAGPTKGELKPAEINGTRHQSNNGIWIDSAEFTYKLFCRFKMPNTKKAVLVYTEIMYSSIQLVTLH
jgi:hypothetical protein